MPSSRLCIAFGILLWMAATGAARAQDQNQQALARAQSLLRQVSAQKQELEATNARLTLEVRRLEQRLKQAEGSLKTTQAGLAVEQRKAARTTGDLDGARDQLASASDRLRETEVALQTTGARLGKAEAGLAATNGKLAQVEAALADAERKNLLLYQANVAILEEYRKKGPLRALLQREPTGLQQVAVENVLQEYRVKLEDSLADANREAARREPASAGGQADR